LIWYTCKPKLFLQAVAVRAYDEVAQSGRVSNVVTFLVRYSPTISQCILPVRWIIQKWLCFENSRFMANWHQ